MERNQEKEIVNKNEEIERNMKIDGTKEKQEMKSNEWKIKREIMGGKRRERGGN